MASVSNLASTDENKPPQDGGAPIFFRRLCLEFSWISGGANTPGYFVIGGCISSIAEIYLVEYICTASQLKQNIEDS